MNDAWKPRRGKIGFLGQCSATRRGCQGNLRLRYERAKGKSEDSWRNWGILFWPPGSRLWEQDAVGFGFFHRLRTRGFHQQGSDEPNGDESAN